MTARDKVMHGLFLSYDMVEVEKIMKEYKEQIVSRDSRQLSAVPSEYDVREDKDGIWYIFVRGFDKKIAVFKDCGTAEIFSIKEIIERGVAG